eukprot:8228069-Pyramimonas_sp.AAC.1
MRRSRGRGGEEKGRPGEERREGRDQDDKREEECTQRKKVENTEAEELTRICIGIGAKAYRQPKAPDEQ